MKELGVGFGVVGLALLVLCPLLSGQQRWSLEPTHEFKTQCNRCKKWFNYSYFKFHHEAHGNCIPPAQALQVAAIGMDDGTAAVATQNNGSNFTDHGLEDAAPNSSELQRDTADVTDDAELEVLGTVAQEVQPEALQAPEKLPATLIDDVEPAPEAVSPNTAFSKKLDARLAHLLTEKQLQGVLDLIAAHPDCRYNPGAFNAKQLITKVAADFMGPGFEYVDIREQLGLSASSYPTPIIVCVKNNTMDVMQSLIKSCPGDSFAKYAAPVYKNGNRVISEFWTADRWLNEQAKPDGDKYPIVWPALWSDKATLDGTNKFKVHLVTMSVGNTSVQHQSSAKGCEVIVFLPVIKPLTGETKKSESFRQRKAHVLQASLGMVVRELKRAADYQLHQVNWPDGTRDCCRVRLAVFLADLEEQWDVTGLLHSGCTFPDIKYLVPKTRITDTTVPLSAYQRRTEADHKERLRNYRVASSADKDCKRAHPDAIKVTAHAVQSVSLRLANWDIALWDFGPENNIYECFGVDRLHQDYNGVTKHIIELLHKSCSLAVVEQIDQRLAAMRSLHEAFYHSDGTSANLAHAEERKGLMRFLPIACHGLVDSRLVDLLADYARMQHIRDCHCQPEKNLEFLQEYSDRLVNKMTAVTAALGVDKSWTIPKIANLRKTAESIRSFGMIQLCDTGPREAKIKEIKFDDSRTNRKPAGRTEQLAAKHNTMQALRLASRQGEEDCEEANGLRAKAAKLWRPVMSTRGQLFRTANMGKTGTWEFQLTEAIPALEHLPKALQLLLEAPEPPAKVSIKPMLAVPRYEGVVDIVRSHPAFTGRKSNCMLPDNVAYRGSVTDAKGNEVCGKWYGQLIAIGTVQQASATAPAVDFLFLRDYSTDTEEGYFPLTLRPLTWAKPVRTKRSGVTTVPGAYVAIQLDMLLHEVCIVPDYLKDPEQCKDQGYFLLNDLVHLAPDDLLAWGMEDAESTVWSWDKPATD